MKTNTRSLYNSFKLVIYDEFNKIDVSQNEERNKIYITAIRALGNVHRKNPSLADEIKIVQRKALQELINDIELQTLELLDKKSIAVSLENNIVDDEIISEDTKDAFPHISLSAKNKSKLVNLFLRYVFHALIVISSILAIIIAGLYFNNLTFENNISSSSTKDRFYATLEAEELLKTIRVTKGAGRVSLSKSEHKGIEFKLLKDVETENTKLITFDILIRGKLYEELKSVSEQIVITFHIVKIAEPDVELKVIVRELGKIVRKKFKIYDSALNELFLIANSKHVTSKRNLIGIRLQLNKNIIDEMKSRQDTVLILKKITFSKI